MTQKTLTRLRTLAHRDLSLAWSELEHWEPESAGRAACVAKVVDLEEVVAEIDRTLIEDEAA